MLGNRCDRVNNQGPRVEQEISGIVLKSFLPNKNKLSVLTRSWGKINLVAKPGVLRVVSSPGTQITFFTARAFESQVVFTTRIICVNANLRALEQHLYWLHHLLEICYFFIPLGSSCPDVFQLIEYCFALCEQSSLFGSNFFVVKKLCLVRLFILLGFYPEQELFLGTEVSLDSLNVQKVRSLHEDEATAMVQAIDKWLFACLQEHPHVMHFKTMSFYGWI